MCRGGPWGLPLVWLVQLDQAEPVAAFPPPSAAGRERLNAAVTCTHWEPATSCCTQSCYLCSVRNAWLSMGDGGFMPTQPVCATGLKGGGWVVAVAWVMASAVA